MMENLRNVSVITLRSGKKIEVPTPEPTPQKEVDPVATHQRKHDNAHVAHLPHLLYLPAVYLLPLLGLLFLFYSLQKSFQARRWKRLTRNFRNIQEGRGEHATFGCHQTDSQICHVLEGLVHLLKEDEGQ